MKKKSTKPKYQDHVRSIAKVTQRGFPKLCTIYGSSEYLLQSAVDHATATWLKSSGNPPTRLDAQELSEEEFLRIFGQGDLFASKTFYLVSRGNLNKRLHKLLKLLDPKDLQNNPLALVIESDKISAYVTKELERLGSHMIPCMNPWPNEIPEVVRSMIGTEGLEVSSDGLHALQDAIGNDLVRLRQEVRKLSLIFLNRDQSAPLGSKEISPYLGMLRQDHAFELDRHMLEGQWSRAHALLMSLISRGEEPLMLLGLFARHCRHAIRTMELQQIGMPPREIGYKLRLPQQVSASYGRYVTGKSTRHFLKVLKYCQDADHKVKTQRRAGDIYLGRALQMLGES